MGRLLIESNELCFHCGNEIGAELYLSDEKKFCCAGCKSVYEILNENNLCSYYDYNATPGERQNKTLGYFEYLDQEKVIQQLLDYSDDNISLITFYIPSIHCSSCLWLLEHLYRLDAGVKQARVDFVKKQLNVTFSQHEITLRKLVELLTSVGYEPLISLQDVVKEKKSSVNRDLIMRIAVAGFCMGNVMLFSFPEYFGLSGLDRDFQRLFGWLNLLFGTISTLYCAREFFVSAWGSIESKMVNLDLPLAIIVGVLFIRSCFEIITQQGAGFTDTLCALIFLLLLGRWVKQRAYQHISFNRDYRSYFPVAVTVIEPGKEVPTPIADLEVGDRILIRNNEIVPADSILMKGSGYFDFSFVTGESLPISKVMGEVIYAGGRQCGEALEMEIVKPVSQSYLTSLWNNQHFNQEHSKIKNFNDTIAQYFSAVVLCIAVCCVVFWSLKGDSGRAWDAFSAVLIVACPCVLALSTPLILSSVLGLFDKHGFFLKNTDVVEQLARINTVVLDKTGTISCPDMAEMEFEGKMNREQEHIIASAARNSLHPLSRKIVEWLQVPNYLPVQEFHEKPGQGLSAIINDVEARIGSQAFVTGSSFGPRGTSTVYVSVNGTFVGTFRIKQYWRKGLDKLVAFFNNGYTMHLLSGDNASEEFELASIFPESMPMNFKQTPFDKLNYIESLQSNGKKVMMIGDGLNDAGALNKSDLGIAVTDDMNSFSPGCDAILQGDQLQKIPFFITHAKSAIRIIHISFGIATIYNLIGVFFAVQGLLSPLIAAVLMPTSTVTILTFTNLALRYTGRKNRLL